MVKNKKNTIEQSAEAKEFIQVFRRGVEFTEELLAENEKLRFRLAQLEQERVAMTKQVLGPESFRELLDKMRSLEDEKHLLVKKFEEVESKNQDYVRRHREIEEEFDRLTNLYVASYQLHSSVQMEEVVRISFEILINLVGVQQLVLYITDREELIPVQCEGMERADLSEIPLGHGLIGQVAQSPELFVSEKEDRSNQSEPLVCIPLQVAKRLIGMFVIFSFLPQKEAISQLDLELFHLLQTHAGKAIFVSALSEKFEADQQRTLVRLLRNLGGEKSLD